MNKIEKMAQKDAEKLVRYADLMNLSYEMLDKSKFAKLAIKERKAVDRAAKVFYANLNKIEKMAQKDAERRLAAEMFYGAGAGTRRKLLAAEIDEKLVRYADDDYADLMNLSYEMLDKSKFAKLAIKERKAVDRAAKAGQNVRALKNGNVRGLSTGVFVVVGAAYLVHQTGYDQIIKAEAQHLYHKAMTEYLVRKARVQQKMHEEA